MTKNGWRGLQIMWKIAKSLRNEVLMHKWTFEGDIKDYTDPPLLWSFLKWVLIGPLTEVQNSARREKCDVLVAKVMQLVFQNVKTNRQVNYDQQDKSYNKIGTRLSIGTSLFLYHNTGSKS